MSTKNNRISVKKVQRGYRPVLTDDDKIKILSMYYKDKMTQQEIADHFGTTRQNVNRLLKKLKANIEVKHETMYYSSDEVLKRRTLNIAEREKLIARDAFEVAEYTLNIAKFQLENLVRSIGNGNELQLTQLNMDKLAKLLQTALPYVIPKSDAKGKKMNEPQKSPMQLYRTMTKKSDSLNIN